MRAKIGATHDGAVTFAAPTTAGNMYSMNMTPEQAERMAHALILQAYCARGHTPGERQFRAVKGWVLR